MSTLSPLTTLSGTATGSQTKAGIQSYLANSGVVWFAWTCPATATYFFKTRGGGSSFTNFFSAISVYQSSVSSPTNTSQLTEFQEPGTNFVGDSDTLFLTYSQSHGVGNGFEMGSYVAFYATSGNTYVIGISAWQGLTQYLQSDGTLSGAANLYLAWGSYYPLFLAGCGGGNPLNFGGWECFGTVQFADITAGLVGYVGPPSYQQEISLSYGSFEQKPGIWWVRYESGSIFCLSGSPYDSAGFCAVIPPVFSGGVSIGQSPANGILTIYPDEATCALANQCMRLGPFNNTAGEIKLAIQIGSINEVGTSYGGTSSFTGAQLSSYGGSEDAVSWGGNPLILALGGPGSACPGTGTYYSPFSVPLTGYTIVGLPTYPPDGTFKCMTPTFQNSSNNPSWTLLYKDCLIGYFTLANDSFGVTANGSNWEMSPTFDNGDSTYAWDNVTIGLEINNTSTGVAETVTFAELGSQSPTFVFSASPTSGLLTATFTLTRNGVQFGTIANIPLYPVGTNSFNFEGFGSVNGNTMTFTTLFNINPSCGLQGGLVIPTFNTTNGAGNIWWNGNVQYKISITGGGSIYNDSDCTPRNSATIGNSSQFYVVGAVTGSTILTVTPQFIIGATVVANLPSQTYNVVYP
jgi:hypothetical protein